jgi:hypothetical protein
MNKKQLFGRDWKEIYGLRLCPKKYGKHLLFCWMLMRDRFYTAMTKVDATHNSSFSHADTFTPHPRSSPPPFPARESNEGREIERDKAAFYVLEFVGRACMSRESHFYTYERYLNPPHPPGIQKPVLADVICILVANRTTSTLETAEV